MVWEAGAMWRVAVGVWNRAVPIRSAVRVVEWGVGGGGSYTLDGVAAPQRPALRTFQYARRSCEQTWTIARGEDTEPENTPCVFNVCVRVCGVERT